MFRYVILCIRPLLAKVRLANYYIVAEKKGVSKRPEGIPGGPGIFYGRAIK